MSLKPHKLVDSGLLILANHEAEDSGFAAYHCTTGEAAANKGFLWAVYPTTASLATLVVTTHVSDEGAAERALQFAQLGNAISAKVAAIERSGRGVRVVLAGDLNTRSDSDEYAVLARFTAALGLTRTTWADRRGTMKSPELEYNDFDIIVFGSVSLGSLLSRCHIL